MSFLDKVKFWKKDDFDSDFGLGSDSFKLDKSDSSLSPSSSEPSGLSDNLGLPSADDNSLNSGLSSGLSPMDSPMSPNPSSGSSFPDNSSFNSPPPNGFANSTNPNGYGSSPDLMGQPLGQSGQAPYNSYGSPQQGNFHQQAPMQSQSSDLSSGLSSSGGRDPYVVRKEIEVISSKLDALRASLDSINQRLSNIERIADQDQTRNRYRW